MKRTMSMFAAVAALAIGFLFAAPAANAAPPVGTGCSVVNDQMTYPRNGFYYYCGANAPVYKSAAASVFGTIPQALRDKLQGNNTYLMIWKTLADANTYLGGVIPAGDSGYTARVTFTGDPTVYTIVNSWETESWTDMNVVLIHEQGHGLDFASGTQIGTPSGVSQAPASTWKTTVGNDETTIDGLAQNVVFPHGIPTQKIDKPGGTWTAYAPAPGEKNSAILKDLFPWLLDGSGASNAELWAHLYQQFRSKWLDDCPYNDPAKTGGHTLKWPEVFGNWPMTFNSAGHYFNKMWQDTAHFVP